MLNFLTILIKEIRPHQWVKNLLIFLPVIASHQLSYETIANSLLGFFVFCIAASSVYILNDIIDVDDDRNDPIKKHRSIASGKLSIRAATKVMVAFVAMAACICFFMPINSVYVLIFYYLLTTVYTLKLKTVPILDVYILSALYSLRVLMGQSMTNITISAWLIVFCMFFFLSLACLKRVSELYQVQKLDQSLSKRRGYEVRDLYVLVPIGVCCALISVLVSGLYINSDQVKTLYQHPDRIWFIVFILLFWKMRLWFLGWRGLIDRDPVIFVITDKMTYLVFLLALVAIILAR